jgi:hypothetical protein
MHVKLSCVTVGHALLSFALHRIASTLTTARTRSCAQTGLVPHELTELIQGTHVCPRHVQKRTTQFTGSVPPRPIGLQDICPICLEELLEVRRPGTVVMLLPALTSYIPGVRLCRLGPASPVSKGRR